MPNFLSLMMASFRSGTAEGISIGLFDFSFLIFVVSTAGYTAYLMRRTVAVWAVGFVALCAGIVVLTMALALRWIAAGWDHPPWTNLYESLVFFSWGLVASYAVVEMKYRIKILGAFITPIVMIAMGLASLTGNKEITPLMPALQSIWLHFHVFGATVSYSMFIVAFAFAILYLFRDGLPLPYFHMVSGIFNALAVVAVTRGQVFLMRYPLTKAAVMGGRIIKAAVPGTDPPKFYEVELPGMGIFLFIIMALFAASAVISWRATSGGDAGKRRAFYAHLFPMILFTLALVQMVLQSGRFPDYYLKINAYAFALMAFAWFFGAATIVLQSTEKSLMESLPKPKALDNLVYKSIIVAVPILSFVIISGAIWANEAWGRYWGWDPKETSSLVTWIVYVIYLHTRVTKGWTGRPTAYIAIIGFASVVFTYLGVNLVLSGLHSYATG